MSELSQAGVRGDAGTEEMLAALRERSHETVERVLRENASRWQSLSAADRLIVESLLDAIASRLLDGSATRIEPAHVGLLRELFGLPGSADGDGVA